MKKMTTKSASFAKGGGKKMAGKQAAGPARPQMTTGGNNPGGGKFAAAGGKKMAGFSPAANAKPK